MSKKIKSNLLADLATTVEVVEVVDFVGVIVVSVRVVGNVVVSVLVVGNVVFSAVVVATVVLISFAEEVVLGVGAANVQAFLSRLTSSTATSLL